jgi:nitrogen regulatory protein PII
MKEIKAYIRVERAALSEVGISHMTLSHVPAVGAHNVNRLIEFRTAVQNAEAL